MFFTTTRLRHSAGLLERILDSQSIESLSAVERDYGIELIAPDRENHSQTQDGRKLRRLVSNGCLPGCSGSGDWSRATNITSRTFSAWFAVAA
jgi:hypothetical protein